MGESGPEAFQPQHSARHFAENPKCLSLNILRRLAVVCDPNGVH